VTRFYHIYYKHIILIYIIIFNLLWQLWNSDAIQPSKDPLEVLVGPVTRLRAKKFKEAFNGLLQDTWSKVDFKRICNNKEQVLINLIHVQEGLVGGTKTITQGLGEEDWIQIVWPLVTLLVITWVTDRILIWF